MDLTLVGENTTTMSSIPTEQMSPTPSAITTNLAKTQPNSTFVMNLFHFDTIKSKGPTMQTNATMNAEKEGEQRHLLEEMLPIIAQEDPLCYIVPKGGV
jgi:hypothetical protein